MVAQDETLYLVELEAAIDALGTTKTLRFSNRGYFTEPTDNPPNTVYSPSLIQAGTISRQLFSGEKTTGATQIGFGEIVLVNTSGEFDDLLNYGFSNRPIIVKTGLPGQSFSSLDVVLKATMAQVELTKREISISIKDRQYELETQHQTEVYLGNNILPNGLEGGEDLEGKVKPYMLGRVFNISPPVVNTSKLIYQVNNSSIQSLDAVYDGGVALTAGPVYNSLADLQNIEPSPGQYRAYLPGGYFRLGSNPVFQITCDATQGATAASRRASELLKQLALYRGIALADINAMDVSALSADAPYEMGIWFQDERTTLDAMDEVANSVGAFFGFDSKGILRLGQFKAPTGTPVAMINQINSFDLEKVANSDGLPTYRVNFNYNKYYTVQNGSELAGAVTPARRAILEKEYRSLIREDTSILLQHLNAQEFEKNSLIISPSDAAIEATRLLNLYKVRRDVYRITVRLVQETLLAIDLNSVVTLQWNRFGLDAGKPFRVIAAEFDYEVDRATLTLWG